MSAFLLPSTLKDILNNNNTYINKWLFETNENGISNQPLLYYDKIIDLHSFFENKANKVLREGIQ